MQITTRHWVAAGIGFVVAILALFGWAYRSQAPALPGMPDTAATTTESGVSAATTTAVYTGPFPINAADTPVTWTFIGAYAGNDTLIAQANADISHLVGLIGEGQYDDYDLYNGTANDYSLLGDGKTAYQYYNRAIPIHPNKGLAYANLAHLMDRMGAYRTAADAYAKATAVEPGTLEYHVERLMYLTRQFPTDNARIAAAFTAAAKQFGDNASVLAIEARWLSDQGRYADAIAAWERAKLLSPGKDTSAIDTEITRLKAKQ